MSGYYDLGPERNKPLPYGNDGLGLYTESGVQKFFDDPDYVHLVYRDRPGDFVVDWATNLTADDTIDSLADVIKMASFKKGQISLLNSSGGAQFLKGRPSDIIGEINEDADRVGMFELRNKAWSLLWDRPRQRFDFHDLESARVTIQARALGTIARVIVDQCMSSTSMESLRNSIDITLDEFAVYEPSLAR